MLEIPSIDIISPQSKASAGDLVTVLSVLYDYDYAARDYRGSVGITADQAIERFGRIEKTIEAKWAKSSRDALSLGLSHIRRNSRQRWVSTFDLPTHYRGRIWLGQVISADHPFLPVKTSLFVEGLQLDFASNRLSVTVSGHVGEQLLIKDFTLSAKFDPLEQENIAVTYVDGLATITILTDNNAPAIGAEVMLDGDVKQIADKNGRVYFKTTPGLHHLLVKYEGYADFEMEVTI